MNRMIWVVTLYLMSAAHASIQNRMGQFFESLGAHTNATGASSYQDQAAEDFKGGCIFVTNGVKHVVLPEIEAYGGIPTGVFSRCREMALE